MDIRKFRKKNSSILLLGRREGKRLGHMSSGAVGVKSGELIIVYREGRRGREKGVSLKEEKVVTNWDSYQQVHWQERRDS